MEASSGLIRVQLEQQISQRVENLYHRQFGHQPSKITCQLLQERLAILIENGITLPEQLLLENGHRDLVQQVRQSLNEILQMRLQILIQAIAKVAVEDLLIATQVETGNISVMVILAEAPVGYLDPDGQVGENGN